MMKNKLLCSVSLALLMFLCGTLSSGAEPLSIAVFAGGCGTWEIEQIFSLSGKKPPKTLIFCTATRDNPTHIKNRTEFFNKMGADAEAITLCSPAPSMDQLPELRRKITEADVIWFDGGATEELAQRVLFWHLGDALRCAYRNGTVMCGYSAGAIFQSHAGLTDYPAGRYDFIEGLGLVNCFFCPHYEGGRWKDFDKRLASETHPSLPPEAYALEDGVMIIFRNGHPEIRNNNSKRHAWHFSRVDNQWFKSEAVPVLSASNAKTKAADLLVHNGDFVYQTGDSISAYGRAHGVQKLVPMALEAIGVKVRWNVESAGGRVSKDVLDRLPHVLSAKPTHVIIQCGINDLNGVKGAEEFETLAKNLETMWNDIEEAGARPIQVGLCQEQDGHDRGWCDRMKVLCENRSNPVSYCDVAALMKAVWKDPSVATVPNRPFTKLTTDGIHPNSLGYRHMAWAILKTMGFSDEDKERTFALWEAFDR